MQDRELVAAVAAGAPGGLAEAYDRYAAPLYTYCRFMLPDPDPMGHAASAVRDTFIVATVKLGGLRDPDKLRSWLHAVARNECLRQLGAGTGAGSATRLAGKADPGPMPEAVLPSALREQVLKACADNTPTGRAYRAAVAHRAGPFGWAGFPKPILPPGPRWWYQVQRHPRVAAAITAVIAAAVAGGITALLTAGGSPGPANPSIALGSTSSAASSAASSPAGARSSPSHKAAAAGKITTPSDAPTTSSPATRPSSPTSPAPSSTSPSPSRSPSPSPSPSPSRSPSPSPSPSPSVTPPGILFVEPAELTLTAVKGSAASGTFDLIALGGPVHWVIHVPAAMVTKMSVSPSSGYLKMGGQFVIVTVTVKSLVSLTTRLVADPGNLIITIVLTIKA